ncbi:polysaccharide biosynthesis tyrosine autokinase [Burkholderia sp. Bp9099]|uniref:polysaccharide biosynthesis tyrosine autokinase n=1 Tax=Burkholderia sp. Bp9099 TaxID=2184568 RepID=UPI000F604116|nr:polysaccharide biosynthesis tyrosine autokinase [Burkholderia sp. Bp9099]RQZ41931.1 protein tyrosine kinase [Burkholderia sp. Bp9099]
MATIPENQLNDAAAGDAVRLADYLVVLAENWRLIAVVTAMGLFVGVLYAFLSHPIYRADAMIQVEDNSGSAKDALGELASIFDTKATAAAEIELIRSRMVVGEAVRQLHLDIEVRPRYFPIVGAWFARRTGRDGVAAPMLGLKRFAWGGERIVVSKFDVPDVWNRKAFVLKATKNQSYELYDEDANLVLQGKVGVEANGALKDKGMAHIVVEQLVARPETEFQLMRTSTLATIDAIQKSLTIDEKTKDSGIIGLKLDGSDNARTTETVNAIARNYVKQNIDRKSAEAEHTLSFLDQQLPQLRKELDKAEDRYNAFRNKNGTVDLSEESRLLLQQIVDNKTKLLDLQQQRLGLAERFAATHPSIAALDAQIKAMQAAQDTLTRRISMLPDTEQTALRLLRDVRVNTELYSNLLNSAQQLKIVKAGQVGNVRVVDYAELAERPFRPNRPVVVALATVLGLFAGVIAAYVRKALYGGVEHSEEIESIGLPVYGVVPHSEKQRQIHRGLQVSNADARVLAVEAPTDVAIEGVRSLRTALQFALINAENNIVMVTGSRPEVGKTFISSNLSAVLAATGKRVLLIDADMRRGDVHSYFGLKRRSGLSDVISGAALDSVIVRDIVPGLDVLLNGMSPPNPSELLMSEQFRALLDYGSRHYDIVIVDTPPVLAVTDCVLIGKHAATTLLVVRHGFHPLSEIRESVKRLRNGGVVVKGALFTDVPQRRVGYGTYYAGYYGYESKAS